MMRAVVCSEAAPIEQLRVTQFESPVLGAGDVRVRVRQASLNGPDLLMPLGQYQVRPPLPFVLGLEGMGEVMECGAEVTDLRPGQRVMSYSGHGWFAEQVVVPRTEVFCVPEAMDDVAAAGFTLVYSTAWHALVDCGRLRAGETVVIVGAAGGIGIAAIQIAKALGARVIALATGAAKLDACREEGADGTVDLSSDGVRERVRELAGPGGVDVVLDMVGGDVTEVMLRSLAPYGRLLIAGYASRTIPIIKGNLVLLKQAQVVGVSYRQFAARDPQAALRNMEAMCGLFEAGKLRPRTCAQYPLTDIVSALLALQNRESIGKIAVSVHPQS